MSTENKTKPVAVTGLNFTAEDLESKPPTLVEFWTSWSRACRVSASVLQEVASELAGKVKVVKVTRTIVSI